MESVADKLAGLIKAEVEKLTVGDPFENADITPLIDNRAADFIEGLIEDAQEKGAKALTQIKREKNLLWPVLFDHVTLDMRIAWEEPFGPLQTSVFTKNIVQAFDIAGKLEVGTVQINNKTQRGPDNFPFLGIKGSGVGVQGIKYSIESMTKIKSIVIDL